jgi:mono/diheme cytochrome c family protein/ketosteroid isomerase-like protein
MKALKVTAILLVALLLLGAVVVYAGLFDFAADKPHWQLTTRLIETARERYIARQADDLQTPGNLQDAKLIANGAGEYAEMCTGCHLAPGMEDTEMRIGLYPRPPNLAELGTTRSPAQQFWILKHGLKMTGMPAWGPTHDDERLWSMVAFLRKLPELTPEAYRELIESGGGGHSHDGAGHDHSKTKAESAAAQPKEEAPAPHDHGAHSHAPEPAKVQLPPGVLNAAETVDSFQKRLAQGDMDGAAQLLDPAVLIFEGGGAEKSRDEYASHHLKSDAAFLKDAQVRQLSRTGNAVGDVAWVATESELKNTGAKPVELLTTETMILQRKPEGWRVTHIHWSSKPKKK